MRRQTWIPIRVLRVVRPVVQDSAEDASGVHRRAGVLPLCDATGEEADGDGNLFRACQCVLWS